MQAQYLYKLQQEQLLQDTDEDDLQASAIKNTVFVSPIDGKEIDLKETRGNRSSSVININGSPSTVRKSESEKTTGSAEEVGYIMQSDGGFVRQTYLVQQTDADMLDTQAVFRGNGSANDIRKDTLTGNNRDKFSKSVVSTKKK